MKRLLLSFILISGFILGCSPKATNPSDYKRQKNASEQIEDQFQADPSALVVSFDVDPTTLTARIVVAFGEFETHDVQPKDLISDYSVDCDGDGVFELTHLSDSSECKYKKAGKHRLQIKGSLPRILFGSISRKLNVEQWGTIPWKSLHSAFYGCKDLVISAKDAPNLSQVKDMSSMFAKATYFNSPIDHWDVSNVRNMSHMFYGAYTFNQPLNSWNVSNVQDMSRMFLEATKFNQPLDRWDVSNVQDMSAMFADTSEFNQNINTWNVSNVNNMSHMFNRANAFNQSLDAWNVEHVTNMSLMFANTASFDAPIGHWNVSNVENFMGMFEHALAFNQSIRNWRPQSYANMRDMFAYTESFNHNLSHWKFTDQEIEGIFNGAKSFNHEATLKKIKKGVDNGTITGIDEYEQIFDLRFDEFSIYNVIEHNPYNKSNNPLVKAGLNPFIISVFVQDDPTDVWIQVTQPDEKHKTKVSYTLDCGDGSGIKYNQTGDIHCIYHYEGFHYISIAGSLIGIKPVEHETLPPFKAFSYTFVDIKQWGDVVWHDFTKFSEYISYPNLKITATDAPNLKNVDSLDYMFAGTKMNNPINHWDVSNIKSMKGMFKETPFNQPLDHWDVSNVQDMSYMFEFNKEFNQPLNTWNVSNVKTMKHMFSNAKSFNQPLDRWNVKSVENMECLFREAKSFKQDLTSWDFSGIISYMHKSQTNNGIHYMISYGEGDRSNLKRYKFIQDQFPEPRTTLFYDLDYPPEDAENRCSDFKQK